MRVSASMKSVCQGQRAGRCSVQRRAGAGEAAGEREQSAAQRAGGARGGVGEAEQGGPAGEVVREAGDHGPGAVGAVVPGGEVRERLVFEVADDELDLGVLAVLGVDVVHRFGAVGDEREVAPVGEQLGLVVLGVQVHAAHDQAVLAERRLGELADAACRGSR